MLIVATHNSHKTGEMKKILGDLFPEITDLTSIPGLEPPVEDGDTFAENSAIKALAASHEHTYAFILADDSGLEVDALDKAPISESRRQLADTRYEGRRLLKKMKRESKRRAANFRY